MKKTILFKLALILILIFNFAGETPAPGPDEFKANLAKLLQKIPSSTEAAIMIYKPETDDTLYARNITRSMIPASNTKLFTTAAALYFMGPNYEVTTEIMTDDLFFESDTVNGNLYVKGFGNSAFSGEDMDSLANYLALSGLKVINGDIVGDDTYFDDNYTRDDWIQGERANVNLPPVSALVLDENKMVIRLSPNRGVGNSLGYSVTPECSYTDVNMYGKVTSGWSRPRISNASVDNNGIHVTVRGGLRKSRYSRSYAMFINNPPLYAAYMFYDRLKKAGIEVKGKPGFGAAPENAYSLASSGIRLEELTAIINKNSDNFKAECLFKSLGAFYSREQGNSFYATQAVLTFIDDKGIFEQGTAVVDGSGISRFNEITVGAITGLLTEIYFDEDIFNTFYNSLSSAGGDGTLRKRMRGTPAQGNFHGKTGTLNGVTALSGFVKARSGDSVIISLVMEYSRKSGGYHKDIEDEIVILAEKYL